MNSIIGTLNVWGGRFLDFMWPMLWQSSLLVAAMFALDFALRRKIRAAIRYALWLAVLAKLLLPPSLAAPTGIGWWIGSHKTPPLVQSKSVVVTYNDAPETVFAPVISPQVPPPSPKLSAAAWVLVGSLLMSAGMLGWMLVRWRQIARCIRQAAPPPVQFSELLDAARRQAGLGKNIRVRLTEQPMSPAVCGLFRPMILLPRPLVETLPPNRLRAVLLHEMIHLRRGDVWMNCAQALLQIFYWWHPLLWPANARIRRLREEAVDDAVMLALEGDAEVYAPTLLEVAKLALNRPLATLGLVGILESKSALRQRIERLVNFHPPGRAGLSFVSILVIAAFSAAALPMGGAPENPTAHDQGTVANKTVRIEVHAGVVTRLFKMDPNTFIQSLEKATGSNFNGHEPAETNRSTPHLLVRETIGSQTKPVPFVAEPGDFSLEIQHALIRFFDSRGVDFAAATGKSIFYDGRAATLVVRATPQDMNVVEASIAQLNTAPPEVNIKAQFVEVDADITDAMGSNGWWLKSVAAANGIEGGINPKALTGILTEPQFRTVIKSIEQRPGSDLLAEQQVTTLSGRQAQIQTAGSNVVYRTVKIPVGQVLDVAPSVEPDGSTIVLNVTATVTAFLGYDDSQESAANHQGGLTPAQFPPPQIRERTMTTSAKVFDGQTLVLANFSDDTITQKPDGTVTKEEFLAKKKQLLVFVTPTLVDSTGKRIHPAGQSPLADDRIPSQK